MYFPKWAMESEKWRSPKTPEWLTFQSATGSAEAHGLCRTKLQPHGVRIIAWWLGNGTERFTEAMGSKALALKWPIYFTRRVTKRNGKERLAGYIVRRTDRRWGHKVLVYLQRTEKRSVGRNPTKQTNDRKRFLRQ